MWLVAEDRFINMNNISSVDIVYTGQTEVKQRWKVLLCFLRNESDQCLFQGSREECDIFLKEFRRAMFSQSYFRLDSVKQEVEREVQSKNVR